MQEKDMNEVRFEKYYDKYQNENKVFDISTLLPCRLVLFLHRKRANYFACILKRCFEASFELPSIADHAWDKNANICWIKESFPKDIEEFLISDKCNENEINDEECDSENEGNTYHSKPTRIKEN